MPLKKLKLKEEELYDLMTTIGNLLIYNTLGQQFPDFRVLGGKIRLLLLLLLLLLLFYFIYLFFFSLIFSVMILSYSTFSISYRNKHSQNEILSFLFFYHNKHSRNESLSVSN